MGMISEICSEIEAKELAKILRKGLETKNPEVINFCKSYILPLYLSVCGEAFMREDKIEFSKENYEPTR